MLFNGKNISVPSIEADWGKATIEDVAEFGDGLRELGLRHARRKLRRKHPPTKETPDGVFDRIALSSNGEFNTR